MTAPAKLIPLPAASASRCALAISPTATDKELNDLGRALAQIEGSRQWWLGDYGIELQRRKRAALAAEIIEPEHANAQAKALWHAELAQHIEAKGAHYMAERAEILGITEGSWRNCVQLCRYYEPSCRHDISFGHHWEAMRGAGGADSDPKKALAWLTKAAAEGWSVSQLRQQVNASLATAGTPEPPPEANPFAPLDDADEWATRQQSAPDPHPDQARACLTRFAALFSYLKRLENIAGSRPV